MSRWKIQLKCEIGKMKDKKILIIDDEANTRHLLTLLFEKQGYHIIGLDSAVDIIRSVEKNEPDLIVMDLSMPDIDGIAALKISRQSEQCLKIPIIILTGKHDIDTKLTALKLGATDYLTKPFQKNELLYRVQNFLKLIDQWRYDEDSRFLKEREITNSQLSLDRPGSENKQNHETDGVREIKVVNSVPLHQKALKDIFAEAKINFIEPPEFEKCIATEIEKARSAKYNVTVMSIFFHNFEQISRKIKMQNSNNLFKNILLVIRKFLRKSDFVSYKEDYTILLLLPKIHLSMAKILGEHIRDFLLRMNPDFNLEIKLASFPEDGFNETEIMSMLEIGLERIGATFFD